MFDVAEKGFFLNAPNKISSKYPDIESFNDYDQLRNTILENSIFVK